MVIPASALCPGLVVDRLTGDEADVGLLPVLSATRGAAEAARLAGLIDHLHAANLHIEHELDRLLDVALGRVAAHTKGVLIVVLHREGGLLGDVRRDQNVHQLLAIHCSRSSSIFTAPRVASTFS